MVMEACSWHATGLCFLCWPRSLQLCVKTASMNYMRHCKELLLHWILAGHSIKKCDTVSTSTGVTADCFYLSSGQHVEQSAQLLDWPLLWTAHLLSWCCLLLACLLQHLAHSCSLQEKPARSDYTPLPLLHHRSSDLLPSPLAYSSFLPRLVAGASCPS
jgi:hypothetical protein